MIVVYTIVVSAIIHIHNGTGLINPNPWARSRPFYSSRLVAQWVAFTQYLSPLARYLPLSIPTFPTYDPPYRLCDVG